MAIALIDDFFLLVPHRVLHPSGSHLLVPYISPRPTCAGPVVVFHPTL